MRKHKLFSLLVLLLSAFTVLAQEAKPQAQASGSTNLLSYMMIAIALVLAFVIWGMGQVLLTMGKQLLIKQKSTENILSVLLLVGLFVIPASSNAQDAVAGVIKAEAVASYGGLSAIAFYLLAVVIAIEFFVIAFMMFGIRRLQNELIPDDKKNVFDFTAWWKRIDSRFFTRAVSVEKEADVMLDHDYDGIRELDNSLPPWWKYGFYVTILVAVIYLMNFHVLAIGKNPTEEYQEEIAKAQIAMEEYNALNKDKVDENKLALSDAAGINAGKDIFSTTCWTCHGKLGEGGAGPNLTDNYWIHKGSLKDIFLSIKHGYPDKGMQAWEKNYSPKEILNLASYIHTLKGTNPSNPKPAQGDLFEESATLAN